MVQRALHYVWYACIFTAVMLIAERVIGGLSGGVKKGAASALGL